MIIEDFFDYNLVFFDEEDLTDRLLCYRYNKYEYFLYKYVKRLARITHYRKFIRKRSFKIFYDKYFLFLWSSLNFRIQRFKIVWNKKFYLGKYNIINNKIINNFKKYNNNNNLKKNKNNIYNNYNNFKDYFFHI